MKRSIVMHVVHPKGMPGTVYSPGLKATSAEKGCPTSEIERKPSRNSSFPRF